MLALQQNLTAEQRLHKATVAIMNHPNYVAMAGVLMIGTKSVRDDIPTACTNGRDEYYGRAFVDSLNDAELRFLMLHECFHKMYKHLKTWHYLYEKDAQTANMACDYVINGQIMRAHKQDGFATMTGPLAEGCYDEKYDDSWNAARVFDDIYEEQGGNGGGGNGGGDGNGGGEEDGRGRGGGEGDGEGEGGEGDGEPGKGGKGRKPGKGGNRGHGQPIDGHDWEGAQELTAEEKIELDKQIDEALRQGSMLAGKTGANVSRSIEELLTPQVDWRDVLREFVTTTCAGHDYGTWARPNRRFMGAGVYMPSPISEQVEELVIAADTSGSIGRRELTVMLSEIASIADTVKPSRIRLLYWGHKVVGDETYEEQDVQNLAQSTKPIGGGGTDVNCVTAYMDEHGINPQAVVVITDGYLAGDWGQWSCPVLWCVLDNKRAVPDVGQVLHLKAREL